MKADVDEKETNLRIANSLVAARFDFFQHVPDSEKISLFRLLIRCPMESTPFCQILDSLIQTNHACKVKAFLGDVKRQKLLHRLPSDADEILEIFCFEADRKLSHEILTHLLNYRIDERLRRMAKNLLFSASCYQDKLAALCLLDG